MTELRHVDIYTDGGCIGNPGPGGWGAVLIHGSHRRELSGGYRKTTNNRMEILAAITALRALKEPCHVRLHSDSEYVVTAMQKGWPQRWRSNGWRRTKNDMAANPDLWEHLLQVCAEHHIEFVWVRGHHGNVENERCDRLAMQAMRSAHLAIDEGYEQARKDMRRPLFPVLNSE